MVNPRIPGSRKMVGMPPGVTVAKKSDNEADVVATQLLMEAYTKDGVFTCPRCGVKISDGEEAVQHLGDEINKSMSELPAVMRTKKGEPK